MTLYGPAPAVDKGWVRFQHKITRLSRTIMVMVKKETALEQLSIVSESHVSEN